MRNGEKITAAGAPKRNPESGICSIPTLCGVWDDISQIELEAWNFLRSQVDEFGGFQVMQNGKDVEIFVGEDVKGRFLFDEKTLEFKGTFNEEEVVITVGDEKIKFSNGGMWEKRPVDIAGVWDKCISEEDLTPLRITVSQKGKKITAQAPGDGGFTFDGKISGDTIHVSQGEQQEKGETDENKTANALENGKIDETSRNIMWQDGSVWCERPKIDVEGTWDEGPRIWDSKDLVRSDAIFFSSESKCPTWGTPVK